MLVCEIQKSAQCHIDRAKCISYNVPQNLPQQSVSSKKESSGGRPDYIYPVYFMHILYNINIMNIIFIN